MMNDDVVVDSMDFLKFRERCDSLRVAASNVAAMAGFHPYKDLVELLVNLVYQGPQGRRLLRHDAALLGISLMTKEQQLMEMLASKNASQETRQALDKALAVGRGTVQVSSIEQARKIKHKVLQTAKKDKEMKNLTAQELALLQEGTRSAVDTGYGTFHEDDALDQWQRMTGCEIRNRNSQLLVWPFVRTKSNGDDGDATVIPMGPATAVSTDNKLGRQKSGSSSSSNATDDGKRKVTTEEQSSGRDDKKSKSTVSVIDLTSEQSKPTDTVDDTAQNTPPQCEDHDKKKEEQTPPPQEQQRPFFVIVGSVDGIRDEIVPKSPSSSSLTSKGDHNETTNNGNDNNNNNSPVDEFDDDDDNAYCWTVKEIIVEVKHRMRQIYKVPPLYEQIQATVYCFMYNVLDADLVQVLRQTTIGTCSTESGGNHHGDGSDKDNNTSKQTKMKATTTTTTTTNSPETKEKKDVTELQEQMMEESHPVVSSGAARSEDKGTSRDKVDDIQSASFVGETKPEHCFPSPQLQQPDTTKLPPPPRCHDNKDTKEDWGVAAADLPPHADGPVEDEPSKKGRVLVEGDVDMKEPGESSSIGDIKKQALNSSANPYCSAQAPEADAGKTSSDASSSSSTTPSVAVIDQSKKAAVGDSSSSTSNSSKRSVSSVSITASRVSLDDPVWQHGRHWEQVILPRLLSFVQAVYSIRRNDDKRYRLLMAATTTASAAAVTSSSSDRNEEVELSSSTAATTTNEDGWKILFDECPWLLRDCNDTAYHRNFM